MGSPAGANQIHDAVLYEPYRMEDFFDMAATLSLQPPAPGKRVAILTVVGSSDVMATDAAVELRLQVPRLSDSTAEKLRKAHLPIASPRDLVDVTSSARDEHLPESVGMLVRGREVDAIVWIPYFMMPGLTERLVDEFV